MKPTLYSSSSALNLGMSLLLLAVVAVVALIGFIVKILS